ncbi:MAG TPA: endonuclease/exonuclease/phosphatase family protein, partial [Kofleriaceae bacterium]|nr:endonuclease/exonuclease/phosphatase family protein [Kofleriaceae bacterium]
MKRGFALALLLVVACAVRCETCRDSPRAPVRVATFNIENFPQSRAQIEGAFAELRDIHAGIIAVQEIGDPDLFAREARQRLGDEWRFVSVDSRPIGERRPGHHLGVLFDSSTWKLLATRAHDDTRLAGGRHKPVLDVRLQRGSLKLHVLVVHLKSNTEGRPIRAAQYAALRDVIREVQRAKERIVLMGDFNATEAGDRDDLALLARDTHMTWASEPLACSAFWAREDGCPRSRLDHVLTWLPTSRSSLSSASSPSSSSPTSPSSSLSLASPTIEVAGACAREGCEWQQSCPVYARQV